MGKNRADKSTMLKIIAGATKSHNRWCFCPKDTSSPTCLNILTADDCSVFDETAKAFASYLDMKTEIEGSMKLTVEQIMIRRITTNHRAGVRT